MDLGDQTFLRGYIVSGEYSTFRRRYPVVLNEFGLTTTQAWVDALLLPTDPHYEINAGVREIMQLVDGYQTLPDGQGYVHIDVDSLPIERLLREGDSYDDVVGTLYSTATIRSLMRQAGVEEQEVDESVAAVERASRRLSELGLAIYRERNRMGQVPFELHDRADNPLEKEAERILLELATEPHWPVHLYIIMRLPGFVGMDAREVLDRLEAQGHPITNRWIRQKAARFR